MRILVTGGAGFIGSYVAKKCLDEGHQVVVVDNLSTGYLSRVPHGARFVNAYCEDESLQVEFSNFMPEVVFHLAGQSSGEISEENPILDCKGNVLSTINLLNLCAKYKSRRFVLASSMACYGNAKMANAERGWREDEAGRPESVYGAGKLCAENYLNLYRGRGLSCVSLRMFNVYGEGQNLKNDKQGILSIYLKSLALNGKISVKGSLQRSRDFCHVSDVADAWMRTLTLSDNSQSRVFNVCSGVGLSLECLFQKLRDKIGAFDLELLPSTPGDQMTVFGDPTLASTELKWSPRVPFDVGIEKFWNHVKEITSKGSGL